MRICRQLPSSTRFALISPMRDSTSDYGAGGIYTSVSGERRVLEIASSSRWYPVSTSG